MPAATLALAWSCLQVAVEGNSWFTSTIYLIGPCFHAPMLSFSHLPWAGLSARLLFFSPFSVPVPVFFLLLLLVLLSFSSFFSPFPCVAFVFVFSFSPFFWALCFHLLCCGFGSPPAASARRALSARVTSASARWRR